MRNLLAIARREIRSAFSSPVAYVVVSAFLLVSGALFFWTAFLAGASSLRSFFAVTPLVLVVCVPAITMRLVSEELRSGTFELLVTMPVRDLEVVVGKLLAALAVIGSALAMTLLYALTIAAIGDLDWGPVAGGYLGLLLCGAALASIGVMCSASTRNQVVAFILSLLLGFALWLADKVSAVVPAALGPMLQYLSLDFHFANLARGVLDSRDVLYFLSLTAVALYGAVRALARRHA